MGLSGDEEVVTVGLEVENEEIRAACATWLKAQSPSDVTLRLDERPKISHLNFSNIE